MDKKALIHLNALRSLINVSFSLFTELAYDKGIKLFEEGVMLSEFGTRRRRSLKAQKLAIEGLIQANEVIRGGQRGVGELRGTSNVHVSSPFLNCGSLISCFEIDPPGKTIQSYPDWHDRAVSGRNSQ